MAKFLTRTVLSAATSANPPQKKISYEIMNYLKKCTVIKASCEVKNVHHVKKSPLQLLWGAAGIKQKPQAPSLFYLGDAARTPTGLNISQNGSGALKEGTTHFISTTQRTRSQIVANESVNMGM